MWRWKTVLKNDTLGKQRWWGEEEKEGLISGSLVPFHFLVCLGLYQYCIILIDMSFLHVGDGIMCCLGLFCCSGNLNFYINSKNFFSISVSNCTGVLMTIVLNLQVTFGRTDIFTILILPLYEQGNYLPPLGFSLVAFSNSLKSECLNF